MNDNMVCLKLKGVIYKITNNVNGKSYIGQTTRELGERMNEHKRKGSLLNRAFKKYGDENFSVAVLFSSQSVDELNAAEMELIKTHRTLAPDGYNIVAGGGVTTGYRHTQESRLKMSRNRNVLRGADNPFYGMRHTEETRRRLSDAHKGKILSEEHKRRIGESFHKKVLNVDTGEIYESIKSAAESVNLPPTNITRVCRGGRETAGGYRWSYFDESTSCENHKQLALL